MTRALAGLVLSLFGVPLAGCTGDLFHDTGWADNAPCSVDNADCGPVSNGIFVSSSKGDASGDGSRGQPLSGLAQAIALSAKSGRPIYACASDTFAEQVVVEDAVALSGAFDCASDWERSDDQRAKIAPTARGIAVTLDAGDKPTHLADIEIDAAAGVAPGESSIALFARSVTASLVRVRLVASSGADGANGMPSGAQLATGPAGGAGTDACVGSGLGGEAMTWTCADSEVASGGAGAAVDVGSSFPAAQGSPPPPIGGTAGVNSDFGGTWSCTSNGAGGDGANGASGMPGTGGTMLGKLTHDGFAGAAGADGKPGAVGGGGGGGGASRGTTCMVGASGGGGGAGGCPGAGGKGGAAGGSSIALASYDAQVTVSGDSALVASNGGKGGNGAPGQLGAAGASGGKGGIGSGDIVPACAGGHGGKGGNGGNGGGGRGGHSLAVAYFGSPVTLDDAVARSVGTAGPGGSDGSSGTANAGQHGRADADPVEIQ